MGLDGVCVCMGQPPAGRSHSSYMQLQSQSRALSASYGVDLFPPGDMATWWYVAKARFPTMKKAEDPIFLSFQPFRP